MDKTDDRDNRKKPRNGYEIILDTYNQEKYPVIENQMNALVFPWSMQRDVDAIDSMRFVASATENSQGRNIPTDTKNRKNTKYKPR